MKTKYNTIPERYTIDCPEHRLPSLPCISICNIAFKLIITNETISSEKVPGSSNLIAALKAFTKENSISYNLRMKKHILEYDCNKISNFVIFKIADIIHEVNNNCYTCYYIMPIDNSVGITITLHGDTIEHKNCIQNYIQTDERFSRYELYDTNLDKIFQLSEMFQKSIPDDSDSKYYHLKVKEYHISESKEYIDYLATQAAEKAKAQIYEEKYGKDDHLKTEEKTMAKKPCSVPIPHHNYSTDIYEKLTRLLSVSDVNAMMFLLGYFISYNFNEYLPTEYRFSVNLQSKSSKNTERLYNILFSLIFEEDESRPIYFDKSDKFSSYIHKADYMTLLLTTSDFNKADKNYLIDVIENYYNKKPKKCPANFIIASKKEIVSKHIENKYLDSINDSAVSELKTDTTIFESKHEFFEYMNHLIDYNEDMIADSILKRKNQLKRKSALSGNEVYKYAPVVYFLEKYFRYLIDAEYITSEQYNELAHKCSSLYSADASESEIQSEENNTQMNIADSSEIILGALLKAYQDGKIPVKKLLNEPCIYTGCKAHNELICFPHIEDNPLQEVIKFLNLHDLDFSKDFQEQLKQCWRANKILHNSNENGTVYKGKKGTYLAFIPDAISEFLK